MFPTCCVLFGGFEGPSSVDKPRGAETRAKSLLAVPRTVFGTGWRWHRHYRCGWVLRVRMSGGGARGRGRGLRPSPSDPSDHLGSQGGGFSAMGMGLDEGNVAESCLASAMASAAMARREF